MGKERTANMKQPLLETLIHSYGKLKSELEKAPPVAISPPRKRPKPTDPNKCIRDGCKCTDFEIDQRRGNRVCTGCGAVQNVFSIAITEPEKRNFDGEPDHRRTERLRDGETGTGGGPSALKYATARVESTTGIPDAVKSRQKRYIGTIRRLASEIEPFSAVMLESCAGLARQLAFAIDDHRSKCTHRGCRLRETPQSAFLIAAALIRLAAQNFLLAIEFKDLEVYLERLGQYFNARKIFHCFRIVCDLLKGYDHDAYECTDKQVQVEALQPQLFQAVPQSLLLSRVQAATRVCEALKLSYAAQLRVHDVIKTWHDKGCEGSTNATIAGAAVWSVVKDDTHVWLDGVPGKADIKFVAEAAGCTRNAITVVLKKHA